MALATIYRAKSFDEIVGNDKVIKALEAIFERPREEIPHVFLFTGPKGCGKTSLGYIIADMLDCQGMDFCYMNSANFTGVDVMRDVIRKTAYAPAEGDTRVWVFDECHQLSKDAQNAILNILESPPDHVYFVLCTTDPQKLLDTVLSRCKAGHFEVQPLERDEMEDFLEDIVKAEKKKVPSDVIKMIARDSMGSCRDALGILDKIIDLPTKEMKSVAEQVAAQENQVIDLCRALMQRAKWPVIVNIFKGLEKEDPERTRLAIMGYCSSVLLSGKDAPQAFIVMECFKEPLWNNGLAGLIHMCYDALDAVSSHK